MCEEEKSRNEQRISEEPKFHTITIALCYAEGMSTVLTYPIILTPADEGGFVVKSPVLDIVTEGDTKEEAMENAKEAILCHLEGMAKAKEEQPNIHLVYLDVSAPDSLME